MHYQRWKKHGNPAISLVPARGTGRYVSDGGYVFVHVPESGMSNTGGYVLEHRLVMSGIIGRDLTSGENVHHMNGVRDDNRPENLELWNTSQPAGQRIEDKVAWAKEILALYDPDSLK